jgi:hypothetical protein
MCFSFILSIFVLTANKLAQFKLYFLIADIVLVWKIKNEKIIKTCQQIQGTNSPFDLH